MRRAAGVRRGFSLLELLAAIGLGMALLGAVFVFLGDVAAARERLTRAADRDRAVDAFLSALDAAVATCVADGAEASGVSGDSLACTVLSAQVAAWRAASGTESPFPALVANSFAFEPGDGTLLVGRGGPAATALPGRFFAARFRYHDGTEWQDRFDSREAGRLPLAIEVSIWFTPWPGGAQPPWLAEAAEGEAKEEEATAAPARGELPPRKGFVDAPTFDDEAVKRAIDAGEAPRADRVRVIAVPDPMPGGSEETDAAPAAPGAGQGGGRR